MFVTDSPESSRSTVIAAAAKCGSKSRRHDYIRSAMASASSIRLPAPRPCPICGKPAAPQHRPFCSARCAQIDLGRWLKGNYRIPTEKAPDDGEGEGG